MNPRTTVVLLVLAVLAVAGVVALRIWVPGTRETGDAGRFALAFDPEEIDSVAVARADGTVRLRRVGGDWRVEEPLADAASPETVQRLLLSARFLPVRDRLAGAGRKELSAAGLLEPKIRLELDGGGRHTLELGADAPVAGLSYARADGRGDILLVPSALRDLCLLPVESLRDRRLTGLTSQDLESFSVVRDDGEISLRRSGNNWLIDKPLQVRADAADVADFLDPLLGLAVERFSPGESGTVPPVATLPGQTARLIFAPRGGGTPEELAVVRPAAGATTVPAVFAPRGGAMEVGLEALRLFEVNPADLRDRRLGRVDLDTVDRIVVEAGGRRAVLERDGETWRDPVSGGRLPPGRIEAFTRAFNDSRVLSFSPPAGSAEPGLDPPAAAVRFVAWLSENTPEEGAGGHEVAGLQSGTPAGEGAVHARIGGDPAVVVVPAAFTSQISALLNELLGAPSSSPPPSPSASP